MQSGFRIGRIFGISIRVDWSWFLIFLLVSWNLSFVFGTVHPDWGIGQIWLIAVGAALLFFVSVLLHELAHALMARLQNIPVRNITLFLFGGVSNIEREPPSPRAEFLITIVGPLMSLVLGILFTWLGMANAGVFTVTGDPTQMVAQLDPLSTLLLWLGPINILLAVFNLIPGFPLDGGRILRSILWAITGNLRRATRWAAGVGQVVAWLFIITGVAMIFGVQVPIFGTGLIGGLWLAFIGWFLSSAATQSYQQVMVQDLLEGVPVGQIMRTNPPTVAQEASVRELVESYVMQTDDHAFPVVADGRFVGLVTLEDVRSLPRDAWDRTTVGQIMTPYAKLIVTTPNEDADEALRKLGARDVRQLPVVRGDELAGLLRRRDIMRWLQLQGAS